MLPDNDLTCREAARLFDRLDVPTPIADAYKERVTGLPPSEWWRTEKMHMADWFEANATTGFGQYTRKQPNDSARRCYNRLLSHEGLVWIAEAVGVDSRTLREAIAGADAVADYRSKCRAIRRAIPWEAVYVRMRALANGQEIG